MMLPVKNPRISQIYGRKSAGYKKGYHSGIDLVADEKDKIIYAVAPGIAIRSRYAPGKGADPSGWGNYVIVRQDDGHDVLFAHLFKVLVKEGDRVAPRAHIGIQGSTGNSTGPHLHFEVWQGSWEKRNDINATEYLGIKNELGPVELIKPKYFEEIEVEVNGIVLKGLIPKDEGRAHIQVRDLAEQFAGKIDWDGTKNRATLEIFSENEGKAKLHSLQAEHNLLIKDLESLIEKYKKEE